jgi:hypothetical protein
MTSGAGDNAMGAGNQQGRPDECLEPSETVRRILTIGEAKIQSELLGD